MSPIRVTIAGTGVGACALTGKETDGLTVAFESEPPCFLSWRALRQLVTMKAGKSVPQTPQPAPNGAGVKP